MALDIDVPMLIQEIQNRPAIYDTSMKEYHDKHLKRKLWEEVCRSIYSAPVWTSLTFKEKIKYEKSLQTKWNSLRGCFRRDLRYQKNIPSGSKRKKKRKYIYFDSLLFLLPFTVTENNESSIEIKQSSESLTSESLSSESLSSDTESTDTKRPKTQMKRETIDCYDEEYSQILKEGNPLMENNNAHTSESRTILGDIDADESFLRSLLPHIKQFTLDEKLQLRIEILKTILNFKRSSSSSASINNKAQQELDVPLNEQSSS